MAMDDIGPRGPKRQRLVNGVAAAPPHLIRDSPDHSNDYSGSVLLPPYAYAETHRVDPFSGSGQFAEQGLGGGIPDDHSHERGTQSIQSPQRDQEMRSLRTAFGHNASYTDPDYGQAGPMHNGFVNAADQQIHEGVNGHSQPQPMPMFVDHEPMPNGMIGRRMSMPARRPARAQLACENCRTRKSKCDEGKPTCTYCKESKLPCVYQDPQPSKTGKASKEMSELVGALQTQLAEHQRNAEAQMEDFQQETTARLSRIEQATIALSAANSIQPSSTASRTVASPRRSASPLDNADSATEAEDSDQFRADKSVSDHSTGVHHLFKWPVVQNILRSQDVRRSLGGLKLDENFVMQLEMQTSLLSSQTGHEDIYDGITVSTNTLQNESFSQPDPAPMTPPSLPDSWGTRMGHPAVVDGKFAALAESQHASHQDAMKFDRSTMNSLLKSYLDNMHILHPIIDQRCLQGLFDRVHRLVNGPDSAGRSEKLVASSPKKRKFNMEPRREPVPKEEQRLDRSISTAIVLLIMALGKICQHKGFLSAPNSGNPRPSPESPRSRLPHDSTSPKASPPADGAKRSQIPGFGYYEKGVEILALHPSGIDLARIQANILASLYTSQLACTIQSWTWLYQACTSCLLLFSLRDSDWSTRKNTERKKQMLFAYWTCFQLEGDLLAEMDLIPSGLQRLNWGSRKISHPNNGIAPEQRFSQNSTDIERTMYYYSGQISIRSTLDSIQSLLYPPEASAGWGSYNTLLSWRNDTYGSLTRWRSYVDKHLSWDDKDPPASNINDARLRAKYWGSLYVINRPLLHYALHQLTEEDVADWQYATPLNPPQNKELWNICRQCLQAAKKSTTAFDSLVFTNGKPTDRLIVTNIFGTAHAQFGNMLVLAATYMSHLRPLVKKEKLIALLNRTIDFLSELAPISSTLHTDALVLRGVLGAVETHTPYSKSPQASFEWGSVGAGEG